MILKFTIFKKIIFIEFLFIINQSKVNFNYHLLYSNFIIKKLFKILKLSGLNKYQNLYFQYFEISFLINDFYPKKFIFILLTYSKGKNLAGDVLSFSEIVYFLFTHLYSLIYLSVNFFY